MNERGGSDNDDSLTNDFEQEARECLGVLRQLRAPDELRGKLLIAVNKVAAKQPSADRQSNRSSKKLPFWRRSVRVPMPMAALTIVVLAVIAGRELKRPAGPEQKPNRTAEAEMQTGTRTPDAPSPQTLPKTITNGAETNPSDEKPVRAVRREVAYYVPTIGLVSEQSSFTYEKE